MASVTIDSGEFKLMRNVDVSHQPSRSKVYNEWTKAFNYSVPDAVDHLADIIEDVYTFELWKDKYLDTPEQFFERIGILGLDLDEPAKLIKALRSKKSSKKAEIIARAEKAKELREQGMTQQAIAGELGVSQRQVSTDLSLEENTVITPDTSKAEPRKVIGYRITQYTKPETAAQKIRDKFGAEFAQALMEALLAQTEKANGTLKQGDKLPQSNKTTTGEVDTPESPDLSRRQISRQEKEIEMEVQNRVTEALQLALDDYNAIAEKHRKVLKAYKGLLTHKEYKMISGALHSDKYPDIDEVQRGRLDKAFAIVVSNKTILCCEKNNNEPSKLPKTVSDLMARRK